jgi:uncharacterized protein
MKLLLILAIALLVVWLLRKGRLPPPGTPRRPESGPAARGDRLAAPQAMVRCGHCGLHLPQSDALPAPASRADRHYCCAEHLRLGESRVRAPRP